MGSHLSRDPQLIPKGPRAQIDRKLYKKQMQAELDSVPNLTLLEGSVSDLLITPVQSESNTSKTVGKIQGIALGELSSLVSLMR